MTKKNTVYKTTKYVSIGYHYKFDIRRYSYLYQMDETAYVVLLFISMGACILWSRIIYRTQQREKEQ